MYLAVQSVCSICVRNLFIDLCKFSKVFRYNYPLTANNNAFEHICIWLLNIILAILTILADNFATFVLNASCFIPINAKKI